jgi:hypothetical protein
MPGRRTVKPSAPTILRWLKIYYSWLPELIESGGLTSEHGTRTAKGLRYSIKALEESYSEYKRQKQADDREDLKKRVKKTDKYFS